MDIKQPGMITLALVGVLLLSPWPQRWSTDQQAVQTTGWSLVGNLVVPRTGNTHCSYSMLAFAESLPVSSAGIYEQGLTALGSLSRLRSNQKPSNLAYTGYATGETAGANVKQGVASHRHLLGRSTGGRRGRNGGGRRRSATRDLLAWESMSVHSRRVISKPR